MSDYTVKFARRTGARTFDNYAEGLGFSVDYSAIERQLAHLERFPEIANKHWDAAMRESVVALYSEVTRRISSNTGELRGSIGSRVWSESSLSVAGEVGSKIEERWPLAVELGRKPGRMPPIAEMPGGSEGERYLIARAIARRGTKGQFFMYSGKNAAAKRIDTLFRRANDRIARDLEVDDVD